MASITNFSDGLRDRAYTNVVYWILLAGFVCLATVVAWDYGFLGYMFAADSSRITVIIAALFLAFSLYALYVIVAFSHELRVVSDASSRLAQAEPVRIDGEKVWIGDVRLPPRRLITEHIVDLLLKRDKHPEAPQGVLLDSLISQLRSRTRFGIYAADVLYKLGMLGTVIGFIQMLGAMDGIDEFTAETLKASLQLMTGGMATALLTTVAGLVCGLILRVEFNMADAVAADVVKKAVRVGDIYLAPNTRRGADV